MGKSVGYLTIMFGANLKGFNRAMKKANRTIGNFGAKMKRTGETLTRNITLPVLGLGAAAVKMASDFEETDAKFKTVFSSIQFQAEETARTFEKSFGLSSLAAKKMLGDTGDLLVGFGFTEQEALNLSKQVNELAVDLASFTNFSGGAEGASLALTKALLGERESIKSLGIAITEADLKKFAEEQGLVFKELDRVAKANLTFQLAAKQSSKAIGDYARTSGSFANQLRKLKADFTNLGVEIGTMLLPVAKKILAWARDFIDNIRNMNPETKTAIANFTLMAAALGPLLLILGQLTIAFAALFTPGGLIMVGILALGAGIIYVVDNFEALKERLSDWTWWRNTLVEAAADIVEILGGRFAQYLGLDDSIRDFKVKSPKYVHEFSSFADAIKNQATDLADALGLLSNPFELGGGGGGDDPKPKSHIDFLKNMPFKDAMDNFGKKLEDTTQKQKELNAATNMFESILQSAMTSAAYSSEGFFKSFIQNLKQAIKQLLIQLAVITAIKFLIGGPGVAGNIAKAFALAKEGVLGLAKGGLVTGPTMALVGEGAGTTASNPEVVAPLDKLKNMIGGGTQQVQVYGRISGNDIFISNQRGSLNRQRAV
tara:strand:+ start:2485 stop:4287 length:1803 start_codon:yes stop_codon:yes gene_type:complete